MKLFQINVNLSNFATPKVTSQHMFSVISLLNTATLGDAIQNVLQIIITDQSSLLHKCVVCEKGPSM